MPTTYPHLRQRSLFAQEREEFTPLSGGNRDRRDVDREQHAETVSESLSDALMRGLAYIGERQDTTLSLSQTGYYLKFIVEKYDPADFDRPSFGIRLLNVQKIAEGDPPVQLFQLLVFVPRDGYTWIQERIHKYQVTDSKTAQAEISWTDRIDTAEDISAFWTSRSPIPRDDEHHYWEIWVSIDGDNEPLDESFMSVARKLGIKRIGHAQFFESRAVHVVLATRTQLEQLVKLTGAVAELRRPTSPTQLISATSGAPSSIEGSANRIVFNELPPRVALFDTGVSTEHPLLAPAFRHGPALTASEAFGFDDDWNHGTAMAGLILHGDMTESFRGSQPVRIFTAIESMKIFVARRRARGGSLVRAILREGRESHRTTIRATCPDFLLRHQ